MPDDQYNDSDQYEEGDEVGWWSVAGRVLLIGGRLVARQAWRCGKWAVPFAARAGKAAFASVRLSFVKSPVKIAAGVMLLAAPDTAVKIVKSATGLAGGLFGAAASGIVSGLGPLGILAVGAAIYFGFFHD
jgi:hypothetical protein